MHDAKTQSHSGIVTLESFLCEYTACVCVFHMFISACMCVSVNMRDCVFVCAMQWSIFRPRVILWNGLRSLQHSSTLPCR